MQNISLDETAKVCSVSLGFYSLPAGRLACRFFVFFHFYITLTIQADTFTFKPTQSNTPQHNSTQHTHQHNTRHTTSRQHHNTQHSTHEAHIKHTAHINTPQHTPAQTSTHTSTHHHTQAHTSTQPNKHTYTHIHSTAQDCACQSIPPDTTRLDQNETDSTQSKSSYPIELVLLGQI